MALPKVSSTSSLTVISSSVILNTFCCLNNKYLESYISFDSDTYPFAFWSRELISNLLISSVFINFGLFILKK